MNDDTGAGVPTTHDGGESTVSALEALLKQPEGEAGKTTTAKTPDKGGSKAKETPEESPEAEPESEDEDEGDGEGDGPDEDQVTEEEEDDGEGDPEAVIAPPKSWPSEMRAHFAKLPPDLQRVIADRENERDATFNRQVNEAAEKRRAAEAELQAASTERRQYLASLSAVIGELAKQTAGEFADIRSTADLEKLANDDPGRYLRWQARRDALLAAQAKADALQERERTEMEGRRRDYLAEQRRLLLQKFPEVADPVKARAISAESTSYLRDLGFSDQEIGQVADHRMMLVVRDALAHRKSQKAAKTAAGKKVVGVPRVQKPGGGSDAKAEKGRQDKAAMTRIARYGTTDEQAAALTRLLEQET
ncbi:MAG TPA: hypothetical protein VLA85_04600 [Verrucomicrobiae bacterium]|nr:hypothetical protein [Verrucomicrobiae bacterium]